MRSQPITLMSARSSATWVRNGTHSKHRKHGRGDRLVLLNAPASAGAEGQALTPSMRKTARERIRFRPRPYADSQRSIANGANRLPCVTIRLSVHVNLREVLPFCEYRSPLSLLLRSGRQLRRRRPRTKWLDGPLSGISSPLRIRWRARALPASGRIQAPWPPTGRYCR